MFLFEEPDAAWVYFVPVCIVGGEVWVVSVAVIVVSVCVWVIGYLRQGAVSYLYVCLANAGTSGKSGGGAMR